MMILKENLMLALTIGGSMAGKNKVVPIFEYIKCEIANGNLVVTSNDGECEAKYSVPYEHSDANFAFCVASKDFINTIKSIKDNNVELLCEGDKVIIKHSKGNASLPYNDAKVFPQATNDGVASMAVMPSDKIAEWLKTSQNFVGRDDLRSIMQGMLLRFTPHLCEVCATDAHKLFCDDYTLTEEYAPFEAVIPSRCFGALSAILGTCGEVAIYNYDRNIEFVGNNCSISIRKIEGVFPNFRAVIPQVAPNDAHFVVSKADFIESVSRAGIYVELATSKLKLNLCNGKLHINGTNLEFDKYADEYLNVQGGNSVGFEMYLKADYLLSCLNSIIDDKVGVSVIDSQRPIVLTDEARQGKTIIQMPMVG